MTGSFLPLSGVGIREPILDYFRTNPLGYGSTFQAHCLSLACAYEVVKYLVDEKIVEHSQAMEEVMIKHASKMIEESNGIVRSYRVHGMAGCVDINDPSTNDIICDFHETHPMMQELRKQFNENGMISLVRGPFVHTCPPLIAKEEDIEYGFDILSKSIQQVFHK